jgi:hypothetical protein
MTIENDNQLMQLSHLDTMLAQATKIDEVTEIRARVEALRVYAINIGASIEECNQFALVRIRAERKAGQVIASLPKSNGARPADTGFCDETPLISEFVTKSQSHRWQTIAQLPDDLFDNLLLDRQSAKDEVTTQFFYEASRIHQMRMKGINTDKPEPEPEVDEEMFSFAFAAGVRWSRYDDSDNNLDNALQKAIEKWKKRNDWNKKGNVK